MKRACLAFVCLAMPGIAFAVVACQKDDARPPVSNGPGTFDPNSGGGGRSDGGEGDGSIVGPFASFPGYEPSGLFADGDTAYLTLTPIDTSQPGEVVRVDPSGAVTVLVSDAVAPSAPLVASGFVYYLDKDATNPANEDLKKVDLSNVSAGETNVTTGFEQPGAISATPGNASTIAVSSSSGGTGVEVDAITVASGSSSPISSLAGEFSAGALQADTVYFYFAAKGTSGGQIERAPLNGGIADNLWSGGPGTIGGMAVSSGTVYFTLDPGAANGSIYAVPSTGAPFVLASGLDTPTDVVVIENYVYLASNSPTAGGVYRVILDPEAGTGVEAVLTGVAISHLALGQTVLYAAADQSLFRVQ